MSRSASAAPFPNELAWSGLSTLALAGGGNRCWWQAGAISRLVEAGRRMPRQWIGTSAGAAIAAACLTTGPEKALAACCEIYSRTPRMFDWKALKRGQVSFAHERIYPVWLDAFVNEQTFAQLRRDGYSLKVAIGRPSRVFGLGFSVALGTLAYVLDTQVHPSIHPKLPQMLGLRQEFIDITHFDTVPDALRVLLASAAPPPIIAAVKLGGDYAFDGGYVDNAPIPDQNHDERKSTLVMLTRHDPKLPSVFRHQDRLYWQPSRPVPVSTWDCTSRATVTDAFHMGREDASALLRLPST